MHVPVELAGVLVRRGVEPEVVRQVAECRVEVLDGVADAAADGLEAGRVGVLQVGLVAAGHQQQLERGAAPERGDAHHVVVGEHHAILGGDLGLDRGADDAAAGEAGEGALLVEDLAGHERQPEDLGVRVGERGAGLAAVVDDDLGVADLGGRGVGGEAALQDVHDLGRVHVGQLVDAAVVVRRVDEHLVDAAGVGGDVHRTEVVDDEAGGPVERRVQVREDAHLPVVTALDGVERHEGGILVARAERTGAPGIGLDLRRPGSEVARSPCPLGHDRDPPPGEWVETQLTHSEAQDRHRERCSEAHRRSLGRVSPAQGVDRHVLRAVRRRTRRRRKFTQRSATVNPAAAAIASSSSGAA